LCETRDRPRSLESCRTGAACICSFNPLANGVLTPRPVSPLALFKPGTNNRAAHCQCIGGKSLRTFEEGIGLTGTLRLFQLRCFDSSDLYKLALGPKRACFTSAGFKRYWARAAMNNWAARGIPVSNEVLIPCDPAVLAWGDRCCNVKCSSPCRPIGWSEGQV
jgi:hypothetical protein